MAGELERLLIRLEADTSILRRALTEAEKKVDGYGEKVNSALGKSEQRFKKFGSVVGDQLKAVAGLLAAQFTAQGILSTVKQTVELGNLAEAAGLTAQRYQELRNAALAAGIEQQKFDSASVKFAAVMGELRANTGGFNQFLKDHLPTLRAQLQATGSQSEAFAVLSDAVSRLSTAEEKAALVKAALGDEAVRMVGFLGRGAAAFRASADAATDYTVTISDRAIAGTREFQTELSRLASTLQAQLANALGEAARLTTPLISAFRQVNEEIDRLSTVDFVKRGLFEGLSTKQLQQGAAGLVKEMQELQAAADRAATSPSFFDNLVGGVETHTANLNRVRKQFADVTDEIEGRLAKGKFKTEVVMGEPLKFKPKVDTSGVDALRSLTIETARVTEDSFRAIGLQYEQSVEQYRRMLAEEKISEEQFQQARVMLQQQASVQIGEQLKRDAEQYRQQFSEVSNHISSSIVGALDEAFKTGKVNVRQFVADVLQGFSKIALQALVLKPLMDAVFAKGGPVSGFAEAIGTASATGREFGGAVSAARPYVIGERGPELFVPKTAGTVIPNRHMGGGGGSSVAYHIDARYSAVGVEQRVIGALAEVERRRPHPASQVMSQRRRFPMRA